MRPAQARAIFSPSGVFLRRRRKEYRELPKTRTFDAHHERYDAWFPEHEAAYRSELAAVRALLPREGAGLEIGVGTGRFAAPLGVRVGLDPSGPMLARARRRGVSCVRGAAEALPFDGACFDYILLVTVICFVDDAGRMLREARRVLKPGGRVVIGFIDRESPVGRRYEARKHESVFYRDATFFSAAEVEHLLTETGFGDLEWVQTLTERPGEAAGAEPFSPGRGEGSFLVVRARRP